MKNLHYTYPEFMNTNGSKAAIIGVINDLYSSSASSNAPARVRRANDVTYEYIINIQAQRFGLNGSFIVYAFLGPPPSKSSSIDWLLAPSLIGSHGFFSNPGMTSKMAVTGAIPLTSSLLESVAEGKLASILVSDVVPYLQTNLVWAVARTVDGVEVPAAAVPGLRVSIVTAHAMKAENDTSFPVWSEWTTLKNVTRGKAGGTSLG